MSECRSIQHFGKILESPNRIAHEAKLNCQTSPRVLALLRKKRDPDRADTLLRVVCDPKPWLYRSFPSQSERDKADLQPTLIPYLQPFRSGSDRRFSKYCTLYMLGSLNTVSDKRKGRAGLGNGIRSEISERTLLYMYGTAVCCMLYAGQYFAIGRRTAQGRV